MEFILIIKKLNNTLSDEEKTIFSKWYNESTKHKEYFVFVKNNYKEGIDYVDIEKGWLRLQNKLKSRKQKSSYYKYAAVASIVLLISINYFFNRKEVIEIEEPVIVKHDNDSNSIKPGTDKATLTLGDGSEVALEKGTSFHIQNFESNGEEIMYDNGDIKSEGIEYNYLTIPRGGQFHVVLSDGTEVWLNSETQLKYPTFFIEGEERKVELVYGEAYFDVSPSIEQNGSKFIVLNQSQELEVLGTEFNIKAYKDETNIYTTLVEGKVLIDNGISKFDLVPNEQSNLDKENNTLVIAEVDVDPFISWKNGVFSFKGMSLKEIMKVMSRWYDIDVIFENKKLESIKFKGSLGKQQSIEEILSIMKSSSINDYEINNKTIILK